MRERLEYAAAWLLLKTIGAMPRPSQDSSAHARRRFSFGCGRDCARAAAENLRLAFPDWNKKQRRAAIRGMVRQLGWMAAEFAHFPKYTKKNIDRIVLLDGFENFAIGAGARQRGSVSHRPHERVGNGAVRPGAATDIHCIFWCGPSIIHASTRSSRNIAASAGICRSKKISRRGPF